MISIRMPDRRTTATSEDNQNLPQAVHVELQYGACPLPAVNVVYREPWAVWVRLMDGIHGRTGL